MKRKENCHVFNKYLLHGVASRGTVYFHVLYIYISANCFQLRSVEETTQAMAFDGIILEVRHFTIARCD